MAFTVSIASPVTSSFTAARKPFKATRFPLVSVRANGNGGNDIKVQQQQQQQNGNSSSLQQQQQQPQQQQRSVGRSTSQPPLLSPFDLWDPFMPASRSFGQMLDLMNDMMDVATMSPTGSSAATRSPQRRASKIVGRSPWDVMEDEEAFRMRVDMPGLTKDEVSVTVDEDKVLVIKGETSSERKEQDKWVARSAGSYESRITVPENVEAEKIQAEFKDGVLYITVPKKKAEPKKHITVQVS